MSRGTFDLIFDGSGHGRHIYRCPGQNYFIEEDICNKRQERGFYKSCKRCPVRMEGSDDPRARQ